MSEDSPVEQAQAETHPVARQSEDILARRLEELRRCFPEAFVEGKVDFERLRAALGDIVDDGPERYTFSWAGRRDALRLLQMPTRATLLPCPEQSIDWDTTQNVFIEGENLETLKLLLRPYYGRVKMIYIDPPYNTGNDFIYRDDYRDSLGAYLQMTGQRDEAGNLLTSNPETSGRYHSAWLTMMYPRLFLARQLLREDGVIFVSIDDHEVHNLRMIMNEVFGEENFIACVVWQNLDTIKNDAKYFSNNHEYLLVYGRLKDFITLRGVPKPEKHRLVYRNRDNDPHGPYLLTPLHAKSGTASARYTIRLSNGQEWTPPPGTYPRFSAETLRRLDAEGRLFLDPEGRRVPQKKTFLREVGKRMPATTFWDYGGYGSTRQSNAELKALLGGGMFDNPKPAKLLRIVADLVLDTNGRDITLDFFAGSCTTAQAVLELNREDGGNRRFIMVQLPEPTPEGSAAREAGFETIAEIGKERIRRVIARLKEQNQSKLDLPNRETPEDLGFRIYKLASSNYRSWSGVEAEGDEPPAPETYVEQMEMFTDALADGWTPETVITEVALKEAGFGLNYTTETEEGLQEQTVYRITDPDRGQLFYLCLEDTVRLEALKPLGLDRDTLFVCRASALDDETAANLALQCRLRVI